MMLPTGQGKIHAPAVSESKDRIEKQIEMAIKTVDMDLLAKLSGNVFKSVAVLAKRSRQISKNVKAELDDKLAYFEGFEQELEDPRFQEEQARVSLEYEVRPEATENAIDEMIAGEIYFREKDENALI